MNKIIVVMLVLFTAGISFAFGEGASYGARGALEDKTLTLEEMLKYAIQDEFLARREYEEIMDIYGEIRPFSNIIRSEEEHISMLKEVYSDYNLPVPEDDSQEHIVLPGSLKEAYETGVQAEIDNIAMYDAFLAEDLPDDVRDVFERLKRASENHLRAFQNNLRKYQ